MVRAASKTEMSAAKVSHLHLEPPAITSNSIHKSSRLHSYSCRRPDFLRHPEPDLQRALPAATPTVLYARIQNRDERNPSHQSPSQAPNHVQTQAHEFPDCTPTCRRPDFLQQSEPDLQRALPAATPAVLYARIQKWCELHSQSYMLEFKTEMSAAEVTNLHPKLPIKSKPKHTSSPTAHLLL